AHKGSAFVEIFQNCNIFNDKAFEYFKGKDVKGDRMIEIEHGRPLRFGAQNEKGIRWTGQSLEVVTVGAGVEESELFVHDERSTLHSPFLLGRMDYPEFPVAIGVFRAVERATYESLVDQQVESAKAGREPETLRSLLYTEDSWEVG
ncbi:MAG: 2-oxoacid:ferredoxin oxidoreductase subunit beta, partial [Gemmatimonadetes bacterium]|nr:2-oxoacid:ferredoxin oxidoreductase subunit beta [Gemmatimonadota bacterium]